MKTWQLSCAVVVMTAMIVAAICQMAAMRSSIASPSFIVETKSTAASGGITVIAKSVIAKSVNANSAVARSDVRPPNAIVAAAFRAAFSLAEQDALAGPDSASDLSQGRVLASAEDVPEGALPQPEDARSPLERSLPSASAEAAMRELPYLKYYVYSELPPPKKLANIALEALSDIPLGTPIEEIKRAADAFGLDYNFMKAVAKIESDFDPKERTGSYIGLFQLSSSEFRHFGSGDITNPRDNALAAADKFLTEAAMFEYVTHKKPSFTDLYLIHQQGWQGAAEHVSHPDRIAWKSMCATDEGMARGERWCKRAIWGNTLPTVKHEWKSVDRLTSGAFVAMWSERIDGLYARYAETGAAQTAQTAQPKAPDAQP